MPRRTNADEDQDFCEELPYMGLNIDLGKILQYITDHFDPEEVFDRQDLETWAKYQAVEDVTNEEALMQWGYEHAEYFQNEE